MMRHTKNQDKAIYLTCGLTGFFLGGPISAILSTLCIYGILKTDSRSNWNDQTKKGRNLFLALLGWVAIGSIAMPISWFVANNMGWNFDAVALMQSSGKYKSYKDWSDFEKAEKKRKWEIEKLEAEARRQEQKRIIEIQRNKEQEQNEIMGSELETIAAEFIRIDPYGKEWNDSACASTKSLLQKLDDLRDRYGWSFTMWKHRASASENTGYWQGDIINALELRESMKDVIKTCGAVEAIP